MKKYYSQMMIFYYVAYFKSFTKAAQYLECSKAYVSQQMNDLEKMTGVLLFHRNTRTINLTLAGESVFEHASLIAQEFNFFENTVESLKEKVQGSLRVTAPSGYAEYILAPNLSKFLGKFPKISLDMNFTSKRLNLIDEKIDVAIRLTHKPPLDRIAKKISDYQMVVCASPNYLKKNGEPQKPKQLIEHGCLLVNHESVEQDNRRWPFLIKNELTHIEVPAKIIANNNKVLLEAALAGIGIASLPSYVVHESILKKKLKSILHEYYPPPIPIYAIYAKSPLTPPKIHAFLDFLKDIHGKLNSV